MTILAILSSPIAKCDNALLRTQKISKEQAESEIFLGLPHYIGHPATRSFVESKGAQYASGLFDFGTVYEGAELLAVCLKDPRKGMEWTEDQPIISDDGFEFFLIKRLE